MSLEGHEKARVIRPLPVTQANLIASNVPEDDHPQWVSGVPYAVDEWVMDEHIVYQAIAENEGLKPKDNPTIWNPKNATNKYLMFDEKVGTQTVMEGGIIVEIDQDDFVDGVYVLNLWGNAVRATMTDPLEGIVFEREVETLDAGADDWWGYFFDPITRVSDVVFDDLPPYAGVIIKVEVLAPEGEEARVGTLGMGSTFEIGCARWGTSVSVRDFSIKEQDEFGNFFVQKRDHSKRPEFDLIIETDRVDLVMGELAKLLSIPCVYIAHSKFTSTIAMGFYRDLLTVLSNPAISECTLTIEGLT